MDETAFRSAYKGYNPDKCVYEKSLLTQCCHCEKAQQINLAERKAMACTDLDALADCTVFLNELRAKATFALKLTGITGNLLPHSKEAKVQKGGLLSFFPELDNHFTTPLDNIYDIIQSAKQQANGDLKKFPFQQCMSSINHFEMPKRVKRKKKSIPKL